MESHINYGILIWASSLSKNVSSQDLPIGHVPTNLKNVKKAQNKVIRAIFRVPKYDRKNKKVTDMSPLYKKLDVLKLHDLYFYNLGILCYDYLTNPDFPTKIGNNFSMKQDVNCRNTRSSEIDFYFRKPNNINTYRRPSLGGAAFWNRIPLEIRQSKTSNVFKTKLRKYFLEKY